MFAASCRHRPSMIRRQAAIRHSTRTLLPRRHRCGRATIGRANEFPDRHTPGRRHRPHRNFANACCDPSFARLDAHFCLKSLEKGVMGGRIGRPVADGVQAREGFAIRERLNLTESLAELQFFDDGRGHGAASGPPRDARLARTSRNRDSGPLEFRPRSPQEMRRCRRKGKPDSRRSEAVSRRCPDMARSGTVRSSSGRTPAAPASNPRSGMALRPSRSPRRKSAP